jgi:hypothetical protein
LSFYKIEENSILFLENDLINAKLPYEKQEAEFQEENEVSFIGDQSILMESDDVSY